MVYLRKGDIIEDEVQDVEGSHIVSYFEAVVGFFLVMTDVLKGEVLAMGVPASGRGADCLKFWKKHSCSCVENRDVGRRGNRESSSDTVAVIQVR